MKPRHIAIIVGVLLMATGFGVGLVNTTGHSDARGVGDVECGSVFSPNETAIHLANEVGRTSNNVVISSRNLWGSSPWAMGSATPGTDACSGSGRTIAMWVLIALGAVVAVGAMVIRTSGSGGAETVASVDGLPGAREL